MFFVLIVAFVSLPVLVVAIVVGVVWWNDSDLYQR